MDVIKVNVTATDKNIEDRDHKGAPDPDYADKYYFWGDYAGDYKMNRWYTYTVSNDVYTLRPVKDNEMLISDYAALPETINCSNVWVEDNIATIGTNDRGYGNDDSVYITVEPGKVDESGDDEAITDVTGVYTGVQNVDIEITEKTNGNLVGDIYTVIDDDQYIIASIVLGEAQGSVENYAYILEAPTSEEKLSDGTYVWEFDVIMGGVKQTLQARSKYQDVIHELDANEGDVMELRFDADEYVTGVDTIDPLKVATFNIPDNKGMDDYEVFDHDTDGKPDIDLNLVGRTLQMESKAGLTFISDAPTALKQTVNGKSVTTEYASVQDAYNDLGDADPDKAGLQFEGRIVAVLNSQGVAEWAYIISDTPINSNDQGGTVKPPVTGEEWGIYTTVAEVNAALKDGNVIINGDWQPTDYDTNKTVTIPANRTLKIDGNFDANTMGLIINAANSTSGLVVTGDYDATVGQQINYQVEAGSMTIRTGTDTPAKTVNVSANVDVTGNLHARGNGIIEVKSGVTVNVGRADVEGTDTVKVKNYGTVNVKGNYDIPHEEYANTLTVGGTMSSELTLGDGTAAKAGKAEIGTMTGDLVLKSGTLVVTDALNSKNIDLENAKDVTVTLEAGIEIGEDVDNVFTDADGYEISGDALEDQVFTVKGDGDDAKLATDKTTGLKVLMDAMKYNYNDTDNKYTYKGDVSVNDNTVTFTYGAAAVNRDNFMNDVSRFLGALVYVGGQTEEVTMTIVYDSETYKWDKDASSKGSKWHSGDDYFAGTGEGEDKSQSNTLIYHIFGTTAEQTEDMKETLIKADFPDRIELTVGGESVIIVRQ